MTTARFLEASEGRRATLMVSHRHTPDLKVSCGRAGRERRCRARRPPVRCGRLVRAATAPDCVRPQHWVTVPGMDSAAAARRGLRLRPERLLLGFVVLAALAGWLHWGAIAVFVLAALAVVPLA